MPISFRNISTLLQTSDQERQASELNQNLPCSFTGDSLFYSRQYLTTQFQNGSPFQTTATSSNTTLFLPQISNSSWTSSSAVSMCSTHGWLLEQSTFDSVKPMPSHSSMSYSETNPASFLPSVVERDEKVLNNTPYLAQPASISTSSHSPSFPVDLNWIGPTDYPSHLKWIGPTDYPPHLESTHMRSAPFTQLPNLLESVTKPHIQPTREAGTSECHSSTEQATRIIFRPLSQDVHETEPFFVTTDPIKSPFLIAPLLKPPLVTKRNSVKSHLRPMSANLNTPSLSRLIDDESIYGSGKKRMPPLKSKEAQFCVQSLVTKYIDAARNKLSNYKAQETPTKLQHDVIPVEQKPRQSRETTARHQAKKRVIEILDQSSRKSIKLTTQSMPVSENVKLQERNLPVQLAKPEMKGSRSHVIDSDVKHCTSISPLEPTRSATRQFPLDSHCKPPIPNSKVDIDVNDEGNVFVTIHLIAPSSNSHKSNKKPTPTKANCKDQRIITKTTRRVRSRKDTRRSLFPSKNSDLVAKFIQAAKNKKISKPPKF